MKLVEKTVSLYYRDNRTNDNEEWLAPQELTHLILTVMMPQDAILSPLAAFEMRDEYECLFSGDEDGVTPLVEDCGETYEVLAWRVVRHYKYCNSMKFHSYGLLYNSFMTSVPLDKAKFSEYLVEFNECVKIDSV